MISISLVYKLNTQLTIIMSKTRSQENLARVQKTVSQALGAGVIHLSTEDQQLGGKTIRLAGQDLLHFGSCSYLGLEQHPRLREAAIEATKNFGTQFSSSRAYVSLGLYQELEAMLEHSSGQPALVSASTTLGHLSLVPLIVEEGDVILLDHQVHASVQMATQLMVSKGVRIEYIRHNRMDILEERIQKLSSKYRKIWYMADGIYSMYGDITPYQELSRLLEAHEQLHLYVDDAHGLSWTGEKGMGTAVTHFKGHERVYIAGSLSKSFAAGGGVLFFPDQKSKQKVRIAGGTMIFSGPLQPPVIASCLESIRLHSEPEIAALQQQLMNKIQVANRIIRQKGFDQPKEADTPIFYLKMGEPTLAIELVKRLMDRGIYVNTATYPSVPYKNAGLRITLNNKLSLKDIALLFDTVEEEYSVVSEVNLQGNQQVKPLRLVAAS